MWKFVLLACLLSLFEITNGQDGEDGEGVTPVDDQNFTVQGSKSVFHFIQPLLDWRFCFAEIPDMVSLVNSAAAMQSINAGLLALENLVSMICL